MFKFTVKPSAGEPFEFESGTRDIAKWERTTKGAAFGDLAEHLRMVDLYRIAYIAAKRLELFDGTFAEFEDGCDLEFEDLDAPDPTLPAR